MYDSKHVTSLHKSHHIRALTLVMKQWNWSDDMALHDDAMSLPTPWGPMCARDKAATGRSRWKNDILIFVIIGLWNILVGLKIYKRRTYQ